MYCYLVSYLSAKSVIYQGDDVPLADKRWPQRKTVKRVGRGKEKTLGREEGLSTHHLSL